MPTDPTFSQALPFLSRDDWRLLLEQSRTAVFERDAVILREGAREFSLYLIRDGFARIERDQDGRGIAIARLGPGDVFGEMSLIEDTAASAAVVAEERVEVTVIDGAHVQALLMSDPGVSARFYRSLATTLSRRLRRTSAQLAWLQDSPPALHAPRTGQITTRQLPDSLVRALRAFQDEMNEVDLAMGRRQLTEEAAQQRVNRACEALLEELHAVTRVERLVEFGVDDLLSFRDTDNLEEGIGVYVFRLTFPYFMTSTTLARAHAKPRGYPDDFETVELILANQPKGDGNLGPLLDRWFLQRPLCRARRGLRGELGRRIEEITRGTDDPPAAVTALSCDTARELLDVLTRPDPPAIRAVCVEGDAGALIAMGRLAEKAGVREPISRLKADPVQVIEGTLDLPLPPQRMIYSLGLAEYLDDEQFVALLDRGHENLLPGGVMVVSTFGDTNPDRLLMEHILEWRVRHRGDRELEALARRSRFAGAEISPDATGVLRLLTCTRGA